MSRTRLGAAAVAALVVALLAACSTSTHVSPHNGPSGGPKPKPTSSTPALPVSKVPINGKGPGGSMLTTGSRGVALTFDDGPDPVNTPKILNLLKKNKIKATFCLIGRQVNSHPDVVRRIVAEGHAICNHSWRHRLDLAKQTTEVILKDLQDTNRAILRAAPKAKIEYFRAPYGKYTSRLTRIAGSLGLRSLYWSVDARDWDKKTYGTGAPMVRHIVYAVQKYTRPGAIVLSHDAWKPDTITAYATLLPWLKRRYQLVAMPT